MYVETYLSNNVLNTIESISMQMLMDAENDPILKEVISSLDLGIIGEREIMQATGVATMQRIKETEENDFFFEFFKRVERNRKSVFFLGETQDKIEKIKHELLREYPKLIIAGEYAVENCVGNLEAVINDMNAMTPDVIVSVLPSPLQEHFFWEHRDKMNANIWYGIGDRAICNKRHGLKHFLTSMVRRVRLKSIIEKYDKDE